MKKTCLAFVIVFASLAVVGSAPAGMSMRHEISSANGFGNGPAQTRVRPCLREDLKIKEGETDAAMGGVRVTPYIFTNVSSSACTLIGYPALDLLSHTGAVVRRATRQKLDRPDSAATLEPGKTGWFNLHYNSGGAGRVGRPCPSYQKLRVTAPRLARPFILRTDIQTCAKTDFEVNPISSGMPQ
ncbi:MAG: DUF4232 domain-containing protein [Pyrinomonadaceae bacterium]